METPHMKTYHAGLDYHKAYTTVCVRDDADAIVLEGEVRPNKKEGFISFFQHLGEDAQVRVVFECGLNWGYLFDLLEELPMVAEVILANAGQTKIIGQTQIKTDKIDARKLSWMLRAGFIPRVHIPGRETRRRREVVRQRMYWVAERTRLRNRVHRILERQRTLEMPQVSDVFGTAGKTALRKAVLPEPDATLLKQDLDVLDELDRQIRENEKLMKAEGKTDEAYQLLESIPGVGLTLGSVLALEIDGVERFPSADQLCAYAGLVPSTYSSGGKTRQGRMLAGCNKWLKWAFIEAAWVAIGCDAGFGGLYRSLRSRGKKANTSITVVARRMCRIAWAMLKERRPYRSEKPISSGRPQYGLTKSPALA